MLREKKCPYCNKNLERGMISGQSDLYPEIKYVGCAECGSTSILNKEYNIVPIMGQPNSDIIDLIEKDIDEAFSKKDATTIFFHDTKLQSKGDKNTMDIENKIQLIRENIERTFPGAKVTTFGPKETDLEEDKEAVFLNEAIKNILSQIASRKEETVKEESKQSAVKEERHSYVLIDEYDTSYVYRNVTKKELFEQMSKDGHEENEFENMKLYRLENPLTLKVKRTLEII